ncbi:MULTISPECIES: lipase family protein [unclassified Sphingobium]|uniref:lipase family protein n=1 Tax=unclassified Sphingobium TaxID=2611147 RepID=UPI000D177240|nr:MULTISPECIES: hypothetical protein [unclassified Sphingobium]MBG6119342.1 hypothetical protein [Sphingobium sp. JAI105]PSO10911.1 hypothetical protein C7E20_14325 [Sphingobium sp. AEW4]TWD04828.1 lipase (class 3) [Sphingobium sp. AEW010]TWD22236.1 lipase (class 3) [Sphingobium sp. AEW013]TWD24725.1 lipase (class 3) [Sphingobium sp. AEW001]
MIRTPEEEWIRRLGRPLYLLINQSRVHELGIYSPVRAGAAAIVAHLAYCTVTDEERADVKRATLIPCEAFQQLVRLTESFDIVAALAALDFADPIIVRTRRFVALGLPAGSELHIGIRGTVSAYDWSLNARAWPRRDNCLPLYFHGGFLTEASLLAGKLAAAIAAHRSAPNLERVFLHGHSLGGAIAAILHQKRGLLLPVMHPQMRRNSGDCYVFGTPRTVWHHGQEFIDQPFALRRPDDFVPRVPAAMLGYGSFRQQLQPNGSPFHDRGLVDLWPFLKWIDALAFGKFIEGHSMERYRGEVLAIAAEHPDVERYWPDDC